MSAESDVRDWLVAHAALLAVVPKTRIGWDAVDQDVPRPYIFLNKERDEPDWGLDNTLFGSDVTMSITCVGRNRAQGIEVANLVRAALVAADQPYDTGTAGFDPENGIEGEVVLVSWYRDPD